MLTTAPTPVRSLFQDLDSPDVLIAGLNTGSREGPAPAANSHIHLPPNFSAFDTVEQAVDLAAEQGVQVLGASNYYDYRVYGEMARLASRRNLFPLFGVEIITLDSDLARAGTKVNDPGNPGKMYICGKGITQFDPLSPAAADLLGVIRTRDATRMALVTERLAQTFAAAGLHTGLTEGAVIDQVVQRHGSPRETVFLQERHVAQAFQEALFGLAPRERRAELLQALFGTPSRAPDDVATVQNEIRSHLMKAGKPAYVEETFVDFDHAYRLILALGGIPCYPTVADGARPICGFETPVGRLVEEIGARGMYCAELIPVRNSPETLTEYVLAMRQAGLFVTAGTEHNTRDMLPIEPTCAGGVSIPEELRRIFWEGACVVAAHQYLSLRGETGFVDAQGRPNQAYETAEERIGAFTDLGAAVIQAYRRRHETTGAH